MDHRSTAQDAYRCVLCETVILESYCDLCHVYLCKTCIGEHISDGYDKHKIVPYNERRSTLIYPKCGMHTNKNCDLKCKDCDTFVCTSCVGSKNHKGHDIYELEDVYKKGKENIEQDAKELKNLISPRYEEMAHDLETQIANLDEGYQKLTTALSKQGDELHMEIDTVINKMKNEINDIKVKHRDILQKHLDEIKQIQLLIQQTVQNLKEIEESNQVSVIIEYSSKNTEFSKLPPKVKVVLPTFIPKPVDREMLYSLFGYFTPSFPAVEQNVLLPMKPSNTAARKLLDEPELDINIQTLHYMLSNVAYVDDGKIWTSGETGEIKCFNVKGLPLCTIWTNSEEFPNDIAVNRQRHLIYSDWSSRTVYKVRNGQTKEYIEFQGWVPFNLCVTTSGDLLVTMYNDDETQFKVARYSGSTEKQSIQFDDKGKPLYSGKAYITENRNHDICVADCDAGAIVVVHQNGKFSWIYTSHSLPTEYEPFQPCGITTDSQSRILTSDFNNHCIHILDQNGQFLRYIDNCDLHYPYGLCVDNYDNLFVCEYHSGNVKKIIYFK